MPRSWTEGPDRCRAAGLGEDHSFATKPRLAETMIERFLASGHRARWATGDEVYGANPHLRAALEEQRMGYVLAVSCSTAVPTAAGRFRVRELANRLPRRAWQRLSAGAGAEGQRFYDWALVATTETAPGHRALLIRRNRATGELAYYRCYSAEPSPLAALVAVAGTRWRIEETFQQTKGLAGLDEHQVRRYTSWIRWVTLAMLAHAFLAVLRADGDTAARSDAAETVPLSCNEIQRLFMALVADRVHHADHRLRWSEWRRRHQARARRAHYRRRQVAQP
ncbi:SRSO17 transposase [Streptomonospora salina]|uniref:SRSO17 transposase n=1 Tax=Streptomonospora salina TaxID=104205 RepID=A0A841E7P6_9ACTN|nr:SRSO17 transposase [Streptomonospora salina]